MVKSSISVTEFKDDENFVDLEAIVVSLKPKECILQAANESNTDLQNIKQVLIVDNPNIFVYT